MKTITKVETILEDGDKLLIFSKLPEDPCKSCGSGIACCGCPDGTKYQNKIKPYKDHDVLEWAIKSNKYYSLIKQIESLQKEQKEIEKEFSEIGLNVKDIVFVMEGL